MVEQIVRRNAAFEMPINAPLTDKYDILV